VQRSSKGFTLLEILIALTLVAILMGASLPYLYDSFAVSDGDRAAEAMASRVLDTRNEAMEKSEQRVLQITSNGITGVTLPPGWTLRIKGVNDARFRAPSRVESWEFSSVGICQPLDIRIGNGEHDITLSFDALTGQLIHDH
jgi:prepilin-type N-terminal cleavage/methylation domain-containing protein